MTGYNSHDRGPTPQTSAKVLGARGEDIAASWYHDQGFAIVGRNWTCREGELDVVAQRDDLLVFCEVKARASERFADAALAVDYRKQVKVRRAAFRWLESQPWHKDLRFDVAIVISGRLRVIEDAF